LEADEYGRFQKKSQATRKTDHDLATKRYRDLVKELNP
jgi:phage-related protein